MLHLRQFLFFSVAILMALLLDGCSAERKNILSKTYHNTTARYNAYFYAKKRIKEIEAILKENIDNDYNRILRIYPEIDSTLATTYQDKIDDCIKKASIAIQRHKNSKWVDDSYIFIGMARLYSLDYVNAIETFKFVNTESEDDNARHEALIRLLRTFVDYQEFENAVAVEDYIKKEKLNKQNQKLLYLNQAHHYQVKEDFDKMVANLVLAAPLLKRKDGKGRIYFIIGQIYQELGFDAEAFNYYRKCLASNPEYELDFYTRLNMAQVTELGKSSDVRAARKVLNSLLKDSKNKEFKDKIYFEMAEFELKQGNRDRAIDNFESSIASSIGNQRQKGQSYLRLGEVYYDTLKRYELAQAYYDSAIQALPQDFENITAIKARQQVLGDFVKNLKTIEVQDSILRLSTLDSASITAKLNSYLDEQSEKRKQQQKKEERKARRTQTSAFNSNSGISSTGWYFGNPSAVALGQSEFKRIWGERPLEDNWRRSIKESVQSLNINNTTTEVEENTDVANSQTSENIDAGANLNALYKGIPFSDEAKQESLNKIEAAYYALGNIYKYDLEEDLNAADAFKTLITRFPETENKPEALYQLYLIYKEQNNEDYNIYKDALLNDFPNTVYAKLIANPNYTEESTATNEKLKKIYEKAYGYFSQENYDTTLYILNDALGNYEETVFTSRLKLLKILVTGKTEDINLYQYQLSEFIKNNPDSEVAPYAEELLTASRSFLERKRKRLGTEYVKYLEQSHYLVYIYELKSGLTDAISQAIDNYNTKHAGLNLKTSNLILNDDLAMILISDFENKIDAFEYYSDFVKSDPIDEAKRNSKFYKFVITKDNFNIFYQSKDLEAYLKFFEKNYINGIN